MGCPDVPYTSAMHARRLLWITLFLWTGLLGQTYGDISGVVTDVSGAAIGAAQVTLTNEATKAVRYTTTNASGIYRFPSLLPGRYSVRVEAAGFRTARRVAIDLQVQQSVAADFELSVGDVTESIEVRAADVQLDTESVTVGTVIENKRIVELPLNGRNFLQLVSLSPNVSFGFPPAAAANTRQGGERAAQSISIAGSRATFNRYTLDGIENTDVNFNTFLFLPSIDSLLEFKVLSGVFPAEFGRATGQVNVSTLGGSNQFHGALFHFLRNEKLDARPYSFTARRTERAPFRLNQFGFTLHGPVMLPRIFDGRNRLFFMSNFEAFQSRRSEPGLFNVPLEPMRAGDFRQNSRPIFDPASRRLAEGVLTATPFPNNQLPASRIHPISSKLLEFYPAPNTAGTVQNFQNTRRQRAGREQFTQRVDLNESNVSTWFGRYSWTGENQVTPNLVLNGTSLDTNARQVMLANTRVLSPNMVNEMRFGYNRFFNSVSTELAYRRDVVSELGIPGVPTLDPSTWGIPAIVVAGFSGFGDTSEGPWVNRNQTFQVIDNFSWVLNRHSLRFGFELKHDRFNQIGNQFSRGYFEFQGLATQNPQNRPATGNGFADFLLGNCQRCETSINLAAADLRANNLYFYLDDTWRVSKKLTLTLGLRYEYSPPYSDRTQTLVNAFIPAIETTPGITDPARRPVLVRYGSGDFYEGLAIRFHPDIQVARDGRLGTRLLRPDRNDWAPRLGLAWTPNSKWVVRTAAGAFYAQDAGNARFDMARNLGGRRVGIANADFPDTTWDRPFLGGATPVVTTPFVTANNWDRSTPYILQYSFNIQRALSSDTLLEVGYLGSVGRRLESFRAINDPLPSATGSVASRRPYREFARIQVSESSAKSNYNSLAAKLQRRFSRGLTYLMAYTWSRSIDTASSIRALGGDTLFPNNSYNLAAERGPSTFNATHRWVTSTLYEIPRLPSAPAFVNFVASGWQVGTILTLQTGFPFTVRTGADLSNTGAGFDRPNATGISPNLPRGQQDPQRFFNTAAFVQQPFGTYGNVGRNVVTGPGIISWDFSTVRNFSLKEAARLQFRFEAFNLPNHPNWGTPIFLQNNIAFGQVNSTRTSMRELQFALKLLF